MIKDKKRLKEQNKKLERNQIRLNRVLDALGVTTLHKTLDRRLREFILQNTDPPLLIDYHGPKPIPDSIKEVISWWNQATCKGMSSGDFVEVLRPLLRYVNATHGEKALTVADEETGSRRIDREFINRYMDPAREYLDFFNKELRNLFVFLSWQGTSVDTRYVLTSMELDRLSNERRQTRVRVKLESAQSSRFAGRLNHRVGCQIKKVTGMPEDGVHWLVQSPLALGLYGTEDEWLPVYISEHALERMRERLDNFELKLLIPPCLYLSMKNPVVHLLKETNGGCDSLVEFRVMNPGPKVGYLVVSRTNREIFIRTFLFLTMHKTPEGNLLHRRLRMARPDFDFHQLERYSTFSNTDIATHPTLVPIFEQCGFAEFLDWVRTGYKSGEIQAMGDDFVRYFKL